MSANELLTLRKIVIQEMTIYLPLGPWLDVKAYQKSKFDSAYNHHNVTESSYWSVVESHRDQRIWSPEIKKINTIFVNNDDGLPNIFTWYFCQWLFQKLLLISRLNRMMVFLYLSFIITIFPPVNNLKKSNPCTLVMLIPCLALCNNNVMPIPC